MGPLEQVRGHVGGGRMQNEPPAVQIPFLSLSIAGSTGVLNKGLEVTKDVATWDFHADVKRDYFPSETEEDPDAEIKKLKAFNPSKTRFLAKPSAIEQISEAIQASGIIQDPFGDIVVDLRYPDTELVRPMLASNVVLFGDPNYMVRGTWFASGGEDGIARHLVRLKGKEAIIIEFHAAETPQQIRAYGAGTTLTAGQTVELWI